jgi:ribosomal protein S18 acetylase RimI-like enzyme
MTSAVSRGVGSHPVDTIDLPDGRQIVVRPACSRDLQSLEALYARLSPDDRWLRFFTGAPSTSFLSRWVSIADEGGLLLVAVLRAPDGRQFVVAEAGYSLLADGDGELGIAVDPEWRGWMGAWLLEVLRRQAALRGVGNLQAVVQLSNRPMLGLLRKHGAAVVEQPESSEIRLVISTSEAVPGWPSHEHRPRILVEAAAGRWVGESAARAAGFELRTCRGPNSRRACPVLAGGQCPLVDGADVVVTVLPPEADYTEPLLAAHRRHPERQLVISAPGAAGASEGCETAAEVVARIERALGVA